MLSLQYKPIWIFASMVLVLAVVWGSLQTVFSGAAPKGFDKVEHFSTYMFLAVWFTGLLHRPRYWVAALALMVLGLTMEIAQSAMQTGRVGDPSDMVANTGGVVAGVLVALLVTGGWAQRVETWLRKA